MIAYELTTTTTETIDRQAIEFGLEQASQKLGLTGNRTIQIECVSAEESQALNKQLRGKDEPTDCISISSQESTVGEQLISQNEDGTISLALKQTDDLQNTHPVIGQLIICLDIIKQQAEAAGQPQERELEWVVEHGTLHVMGFHHDHDAG